MLTRSFKPLQNLLKLNSRCFSTPAFNGYQERVNSLKSQYPGFFSSSFEDEQREVLSNSSNLDSMVNDYNNKREEVHRSCGEDLFMTLDTNTIMSTPPRIVHSHAQTDEQAQTKLEIGTNLMNELNSVYNSSASDVADQNLRMMNISNLADEIQNWRLRLGDPYDESSDMGLPIDDQELDDYVRRQYANAPDDVRRTTSDKDDDLRREIDWIEQLDGRVYDELLSSRGVDRNRWDNFCEVTNEMFHPHNVDHYGFSNYSKLLFRAAIWESENEIDRVSDSMKLFEHLYSTSTDNDPGILRNCYELFTDTPYPGLAAYFLQITDPLFSARLVNEVRDEILNTVFQRAVRDVTRDFEVNIINEERSSVEQDLINLGTESTVLTRKIRELTQEAEDFNIEPPSLDEVLDQILPRKLWSNDTSNVKKAITSYASGSASLNDVTNAINDTLNPNLSENDNVDEDLILKLMIRYHNSITDDVSNMNLEGLLNYVCDPYQRKEFSTIVQNKTLIRRLLESYNIHPLVINIVKQLIDAGECQQLPRIIQDFHGIVKKHKGELDGTITSAQELSSSDFEMIKNAIESQNTGKKITLETFVDNSLQSGFVVTVGVNKWNFSLANVVDQGRRNVEK